jgi:flagellar basal-body rod protein FlgC
MSHLLSAVNAAASALDVQRARMEVAISNMANADSTRGPNGEPYRRRDVALEAVPSETFGQAMNTAGTGNADGVKIAAVIEDQEPFRRRYEPSHPDADKDGFVSVPNVDVPEEMVNMLGAARAYQANLTAIGLIRDTVQKALELAK